MKTAKCNSCGQEVQVVPGQDFGPGTGGDGKLRVALAQHLLGDGVTPCKGGEARIDHAPPKMRRASRYDAGELGPPEPQGNGWLRVQGRISRVGIQEYSGPNGELRRELRTPEEVFDPASIASFKLVPLTNTHPPQLLDDKNAKFYTVGSIGELRREGDWLCAELLITEAEARRDAEGGRSELSNGYECDLDEAQLPALVEKWGPYDAIQRNIRGNHCALVDQARAGHEARARMDAQTDLMVASTQVKRGASAMPPTVKIDGLTLEVTDANASAIQQAIDKLTTDTRAQILGITKRADGAEAKSTKAFALFDSLHEILRRGKKRRDGMKARMMSCDECGGSGEIKGDEDGAAASQCDYCDGKGEFRMHDKFADVAGKPVLGEDKEHGEAGPDPTDDDDDMDDADELAVERETEETGAEAAGKGKAKKDGIADRRRARKDSRRDSGRKLVEAARKARADSLARRIDRGVRSRTKLVALATAHCGEGFKADGKSDADLRKAVILAAWPETKLDGKSEAYLAARFDVAVEELGATATATDRVRELAGGTGARGGGRTDGGMDPTKARQDMIKSYDNVAAIKKPSAIK
jgi:hypothetical protein